MSVLPSAKRDRFVRALVKMGATVEEARGGGSGNKVAYKGRRTNFHVHPSKEIGPSLGMRILKDLGISPEEFVRYL